MNLESLDFGLFQSELRNQYCRERSNKVRSFGKTSLGTKVDERNGTENVVHEGQYRRWTSQSCTTSVDVVQPHIRSPRKWRRC